MAPLRWTPRLAMGAMLLAMLIFGSNFALSRYAVQHGLAPFDLVALRYLLAGPVMLPVFWRLGVRTCAGIGWRRGLLLAVISGAPMTLAMSTGALLAPAAHGAALGPGTVTTVGIVCGIVVSGRLPPPLTRLGLAVVVAGLACVALAGAAHGARSVVLGDLCFFATGLMWGFYPVLLHAWRLDGLVGAAVTAVLSMAYMPVYVLFLEPRLLTASPVLVASMAVYQGLLNSIAGLWLWGKGVRILGASGVLLFPPLIPVVGTLCAIPILGEWPGLPQALGVLLIVAGLALSAFGNRAPRLPRI